MGNTARGSGLKGCSDSSVCLVACRVTGALQHRCSRTSRGLDTVPKPARGRKKILSALRTRGDILLSISRVGPRSQQRDDDRWGRGSELVDRPHAHRGLAKLGDDGGRVSIGRSKLSHQRRSPCDEVLEGSLIQARHIHGPAV